jgi:hypothetical protein
MSNLSQFLVSYAASGGSKTLQSVLFDRSTNPSGTATWTVPSGVNHVWIDACGGGQGGQGGITYAQNWFQSNNIVTPISGLGITPVNNGMACSSDAAYILAYTGAQIYKNNTGSFTTYSSLASFSGAGYVSMSASGQYQTYCYGGLNPTFKVSTDYGANWTTTNPLGASYQALGLKVSSTGQYQVVTTNSSTIFVSTNYGSSWTTKTLPSNIAIGPVSISTNGQYIFVMGSSTCYYSSNGGTNWTSKTVTTITTSGFNGVDLKSSRDGSILYLVASNSSLSYMYVAKSTDYGSTWNVSISSTSYGYPYASSDCTEDGAGFIINSQTMYQNSTLFYATGGSSYWFYDGPGNRIAITVNANVKILGSVGFPTILIGQYYLTPYVAPVKTYSNGGASSASLFKYPVSVTPAQTLTMSIGSKGTGGAAGTITSSGTRGTIGGSTTIAGANNPIPVVPGGGTGDIGGAFYTFSSYVYSSAYAKVKDVVNLPFINGSPTSQEPTSYQSFDFPGSINSTTGHYSYFSNSANGYGVGGVGGATASTGADAGSGFVRIYYMA